jgi:hypothetical protein
MAVFLAAGCHTGGLDMNKEYTFLGVYLEARNGAATGARMVKVLNVPFYVESEPFLTEADVSGASLVDYPDGTYAVTVTCSDHGRLVLDMTTSSSKGLNMVIFTFFPQPGWGKPKGRDAFSVEKAAAGQPRFSSWSAVRIGNNLSNGTFRFTPEASRAEAERMVRGLNNMAAEVEKQDR